VIGTVSSAAVVPLRRGAQHSSEVVMAKLSKKERRALEKAFREQVKPLSVSLMDQAKNFYRAVGQGISHWASMEGRLVQIVAKLTRMSEDKAGLIMYSINNFYSVAETN